VTGSSQTAIERPASLTRTDRQLDALLPPEMAARAEGVGVRKVRLDAVSLFALAVLAGAFIVDVVYCFVYLRRDRRGGSEASSDAQGMS
jgi:hypothetical protein